MDPCNKGQPLDEDDEFEEFDIDDWGRSQEELNNMALWDKSWDDDDVEDYVGSQIRTVVEAAQQQPAQPEQQPTSG